MGLTSLKSPISVSVMISEKVGEFLKKSPFWRRFGAQKMGSARNASLFFKDFNDSDKSSIFLWIRCVRSRNILELLFLSKCLHSLAVAQRGTQSQPPRSWAVFVRASVCSKVCCWQSEVGWHQSHQRCTERMWYSQPTTKNCKRK